MNSVHRLCMARAVLLSLVIGLSMLVVCRAQPVDVYFSQTSAKLAPDSPTISAGDCPESDPCLLLSDTIPGPWHRFYPDQSINAIFLHSVGPTNYYQLTASSGNSFGCGGDLVMIFQDATFLSYGTTSSFGNATHRPRTITIRDSILTIDNAYRTAMYFNARASINLINTTYVPVYDGLASAQFQVDSSGNFSAVDVQVGWTYNPASLFDIRSRSGPLVSITFQNVFISHTAQKLISISADSVYSMLFDNFQFKETFALSSGFISSILGPRIPVEIFTMQYSSLEYSDIEPNFEIAAKTIQFIGCNFLSSSLAIYAPLPQTGTSIQFYNTKMDTSYLQVSGYSTVNFASNFFSSSTVLVLDTPKIQVSYDRYESNSNASLVASDLVSFERSSAINSIANLGSTLMLSNACRSVRVAYSTFQTNGGGGNETNIYSSDIVLLDSSWEGETSVVSSLLITPRRLDIPTRIQGRATIDELRLETSVTYEILAEIHLLTGLFGSVPNTALVNRGVIAFHSNPVTCTGVELSNILILPPTLPTERSILSAVVWNTGSGCSAMVSLDNGFDPAAHILEIKIERSSETAPVTENQNLTIFKVRQSSITRGIREAAEKNVALGVDFMAYYPSTNYALDSRYGFNGILNFASDIYSYTVTDISCPNDCSGNGPCIGANTCQCNLPYSGYSCQCRDLPPGVECSSNVNNYWVTNSNLIVGNAGFFAFPESTGGFINGSILNQGSLALSNARYDISEGLLNEGNITIVSSISQSPGIDENGVVGCTYVPTARSFASDISFGGNSIVTIVLDLASASSSQCSSGTVLPPNVLPSKRDTINNVDAFSILNSKRGAYEATGTISQSATSSNTRSSKSTSILEADSSDTREGKMIVRIGTAPIESIETVLFTTRNATKGTTDSTLIAVEVQAPEGTCTSVKQKAGVVTLFATPCANEPKSKGKGVLWYYYGIPIIAVGAIVLIIVTVSVVVPKARSTFVPYKGANT